MSSPLSPVVANIFIEAFETVALEYADLKPEDMVEIFSLYFRYLVSQQKRPPNFFFNNQRPDIKFTMKRKVKRSSLLAWLTHRISVISRFPQLLFIPEEATHINGETSDMQFSLSLFTYIQFQFLVFAKNLGKYNYWFARR